MDQLAGRASVLGSHSVQQVRRFGSRSVTYARQKIDLFNEVVRGRKTDRNDAQNSSTSSDKNSQNRDSSKECLDFEKRMLCVDKGVLFPGDHSYSRD